MRAVNIAATAVMALALPARAQDADCQPGESVIRFARVVEPKGHPKGEAAAELARRLKAELEGLHARPPGLAAFHGRRGA